MRPTSVTCIANDEKNFVNEEDCSISISSAHDSKEQITFKKVIKPVASWFRRRLGVWKEATTNIENDDDTEEIIYPEEINSWHSEDDLSTRSKRGLLLETSLSSNQSKENITAHSLSEEESYEDIACGTDESRESLVLSSESSYVGLNEYITKQNKGRNRRLYALINSATQGTYSFMTPNISSCRWSRTVRSYTMNYENMIQEGDINKQLID